MRMCEKCLICYKDLSTDDYLYHGDCQRKSFLKDVDPVIPYSLNEMNELATKVIRQSISVPGMQPKLSINTYKASGEKNYKLTLINYNARFILKPQSEKFPQIPENEDLTMKLANLSGIKTVPYVLAVLKSGEKVYLSKRIDRSDKGKIHMEDLCQATGKLTEHKYRGSVENVGKTIFRYSENKMFDVITFFDVVLFCFLTGNSDMHLKNYSFIYNDGMHFSPAYDLLNTRIVVPDDKEESALTINGKKSKIKINDFNMLASELHIPEKSRDNMYRKYSRLSESFSSMITLSFLDDYLKDAYIRYYEDMMQRLELT
jgi:serine/threonine-protein kinase HipA